MNCPECLQVLQEQLDGCTPAGQEAVAGHLAVCPSCRELFAAGRLMQKALAAAEPPAPPSLLAERVVARVLSDRRRRAIMRRRLVPAAVAASILLMFGVLYLVKGQRTQDVAKAEPSGVDSSASSSRPPDFLTKQDNPPGSQATEPGGRAAMPSLDETIAEAGSALAGLSRRTADEAIGHGRLLLPDAKPTTQARADLLQDTLEPPARSLREAGHGLSAGLEPIANSARRAVNLFLKDLTPVEPAARQGT